jgi:hypothetical protein
MARCARRMVQHRWPVARRLGVKRYSRIVAGSHRTESIQDAGVDDSAPVRRDRLLHRQPRDLVTEPQPPAILGQQPGGEDLIHRRQWAPRGRRQQIQFDTGADERSNFKHLARPAAQPRSPRQYRIARRRRDGAQSGLHHFGDVERVPAWIGIPIRRSLCSRLGTPVALPNDR